MEEIIVVVIFVAVAALIVVYNMGRQGAIKKDGFATIGEVTGYDSKFMRIAGTWTWAECPKVRYQDKNEKVLISFIKNAKAGNRSYPIGHKVKIIIYQGSVYAEDGL